jgi:ElaB/YqjD/DUF883 family membrane-anchored ribosome-binding protein
MYEKIPESINGATAFLQKTMQGAVADFQQPLADFSQLKMEIEKLMRLADQSAKEAETSRARIGRELLQIAESLRNIDSSINAGAEKAAAAASNRMTELLSAAMKNSMPLSDLREAGMVFLSAVRDGRKASEELRENVKAVWRTRFGTIAVHTAICVIFIILGTWGFFYSWSERRIDEAREHYVWQISNNNEVVSKLAKSNRVLILTTDKERGTNLLVMENATGSTLKNHGAIIFK